MQVQKHSAEFQMNDSNSLMNQLKDSRTQKISAEFKVEKQKSEIQALKEALRVANEKADTIASKAAEKEEMRASRLRKQLKDTQSQVASQLATRCSRLRK